MIKPITDVFFDIFRLLSNCSLQIHMGYNITLDWQYLSLGYLEQSEI